MAIVNLPRQIYSMCKCEYGIYSMFAMMLIYGTLNQLYPFYNSVNIWSLNTRRGSLLGGAFHFENHCCLKETSSILVPQCQILHICEWVLLSGNLTNSSNVFFKFYFLTFAAEFSFKNYFNLRYWKRFPYYCYKKTQIVVQLKNRNWIKLEHKCFEVTLFDNLFNVQP